MIDLKQYAQMIETGLNLLLDRPQIRFTVWTDVGKYKQAVRKYNRVETYINCLLTRSPGSIQTGNGGLIIASDSITLQVAVPTQEPRQTVEAPEPEISDDSFVFVEQVRKVMDTYFSQNTIRSFTDEDGKTYETGMVYSLSATGDAELSAMIGSYVTFSVYITVNIVQNGINSRSVEIELDGESVPFLSASPSRASVKSTEVYSDSHAESENLIVSTVAATDVNVPATSGRVTSQFIRYLLHGENVNSFHFLKRTIGDESRYDAVTFGDSAASIEGSLNIGQSINFIKLRNFPDILSFPAYFTVARGVFENAPESPVKVEISPYVDCILMIGDKISETKAGESATAEISADHCEYDEGNGTYYFSVCACPKGNNPVTLASNVSLTVIQQGVANG